MILLPVIAASRVLSFLRWHDKLHAVKALPSWGEALASTVAWTDVKYHEDVHRPWHRRKFTNCIQMYGSYMGTVELYSVRLWEEFGEELLNLIGDHCVHLKRLKLDHCLTELEGKGWRYFSQILESCTKLRQLSFIHTDIVCDKDCPLLREEHALKLRELIFKCDKPQYIKESIAKCKYLHTLRIRRQDLTEANLLQLVESNLSQLSVYQDEEVAFGEAMMYKNDTWNQVMHFKCNFNLTFILKDIIVVRGEFPADAPLRKLILVDIAGSLTKGILDTIGQYYHSTLETFVYSNRCGLTCTWPEDKRLPHGLVELVRNCPLLTTLVYGFELSSTTVLLLAGSGHLHELLLLEDALVYDMDWPMQAHWSLTFINWLKTSGSSLISLQVEISRLLRQEWQPIKVSNWQRHLDPFEKL